MRVDAVDVEDNRLVDHAGFEVSERGLVDTLFLTLPRHGLDHDRAFGGRQLQRLASVRVEQRVRARGDDALPIGRGIFVNFLR